MKFTVVDNRVVCSRKDSTVTDEDVYRQVVEFDAHVETVPPHVAARLTTGEVKELKAFIEDRRRIRATPLEKNKLEALPELLREATEIVESVNGLNRQMYENLLASIGGLRSALDKIKPSDEGRMTPISNMRDSEAQKERLEVIKQDL